MNVSPVIASQILQTDFISSISARPVVYSAYIPAPISASVVDISMPGKLLSDTVIFGNEASQTVATAQSSLATVVDTSQRFVDIFNSFLQSSSDSLQYLSGGSLSDLFLPVLDSQATAVSVNGKSIIARLADIGIKYEAPSLLNETGQMTIDIKSLQSAFNADPTGVSTLLNQAIQYIGPLATAALNRTLTTTEPATPPLAAEPNVTTTGVQAAPTEPIVSTIASPAANEIVTPMAQTITPALPAATTPLATTATVEPAVVVPNQAPLNFVNPITVATDPATAAAIAAYHLVDGVFDTGMPHVDGHSTATHSYSEILAVAKIRPITLNLYA